LLTHITFQGDIGIGFSKNIPGRARSWAEGTLTVLLPFDYYSMSAHAFHVSKRAGQYWEIQIIILVREDPDSGPTWIHN
jgi:hypothetical protein